MDPSCLSVLVYICISFRGIPVSILCRVPPFKHDLPSVSLFQISCRRLFSWRKRVERCRRSQMKVWQWWSLFLVFGCRALKIFFKYFQNILQISRIIFTKLSCKIPFQYPRGSSKYPPHILNRFKLLSYSQLFFHYCPTYNLL